RYDEAVVDTLKCTVSPRFALMSVANPWIVESPEPDTSHSDFGLPVSRFSHTMGFGPHCAVIRVPLLCETARTMARPREENRRMATGRRRRMGTRLSSLAPTCGPTPRPAARSNLCAYVVHCVGNPARIRVSRGNALE